MTFPELEYISWAKSLPAADINLARSGIEHCPPSLLRLEARDLVANLPVKYGYGPLKTAIAKRYGVGVDRVFTVSGGTSFANWVACAAVRHGAGRGAEALVERPTYEPLVKVPEALGFRVRRFDRRFADAYAIDLGHFAARITSRTRLAIVSNLHNPSGARIDMPTLAKMARLLARVGATLLVDEVYLECVFRDGTESCVHAGPNVLTTNSLTKAYGLDGLRAGWILGPPRLIGRAGLVNDLMTNNGVAPGEQMALAAFARRRDLHRRAHAILDPNLARLRRFFEGERRLDVHVPEGGNVAFPRLPSGVESDRLAARLLTRYSTLVVPGRFFGSRRHIRISFGCTEPLLAKGLANISRALTDENARRVEAPNIS
jgi:aspartate/methionine/tyrosine aminotransferase